MRPAAPGGRPARAQLGVSLLFFTNGALFSALLPRYPEVKNSLGLADAPFGLLVVAPPLAAIAAVVPATWLVRRFGARKVAGVGSVLLAAAVALAAFGAAGTVFTFAAALLAIGFLDAIVDAAQNVQAIAVEQWRSRSIMNTLHAVWSLGATGGGLIGTWAAATQVPLTVHLGVNGALWAVVAVAGSVLAGTPHDHRPGTAVCGDQPSGGWRPWRLIAPLGLLAICGTLLEEFAQSWATLFVGRETDAPAGVAGLGFTVILASQFVGRLLGDPMTDRWGRSAVARAGGLVVAAGVVLALLTPVWWLVLAGFGLVGFGCATLVPAAYAAAGRIPGFGHGTGVAVLGWLMRLGFLLTSPVIGVISDAAGLRAALLVPLGAGLVAAAVVPSQTRNLRAWRGPA